MFKGILLCFAVLVVQLVLLNAIDARQQKGSPDVRPTASNTALIQRQDDEEEEA